jgi:hypothetical protein
MRSIYHHICRKGFHLVWCYYHPGRVLFLVIIVSKLKAFNCAHNWWLWWLYINNDFDLRAILGSRLNSGALLFFTWHMRNPFKIWTLSTVYSILYCVLYRALYCRLYCILYCLLSNLYYLLSTLLCNLCYLLSTLLCNLYYLLSTGVCTVHSLRNCLLPNWYYLLSTP